MNNEVVSIIATHPELFPNIPSMKLKGTLKTRSVRSKTILAV